MSLEIFDIQYKSTSVEISDIQYNNTSVELSDGLPRKREPDMNEIKMIQGTIPKLRWKCRFWVTSSV